VTAKDLHYVIGVGGTEDWEAGRGSLYHIEDRNGEKALPVFSAPEKAEEYGRANFDAPEAHMQMLETLPASHVAPLTASRFIVMPLYREGLAKAALLVDADYLVRDPRPGREQEIMRVKGER
jgi:hypothetical protein